MRRLTFAAENGVIKLISEQEVDMQTTSAPGASQDAQHPFWLEMRDAADSTLMAQPMRDPLPNTIEVFSDDPLQSARHVHDPRTEQAFSVVLPSLPDADSVVLMRAGTAPGIAPTALGAGSGATEIGRFKLSK